MKKQTPPKQEAPLRHTPTPSPAVNPAGERKRRLQQLREKLAKERHNWTRWMTRLKRAFHMIEKIQRRGTRLEREIARLEQE